MLMNAGEVSCGAELAPIGWEGSVTAWVKVVHPPEVI